MTHVVKSGKRHVHDRRKRKQSTLNHRKDSLSLRYGCLVHVISTSYQNHFLTQLASFHFFSKYGGYRHTNVGTSKVKKIKLWFRKSLLGVE